MNFEKLISKLKDLEIDIQTRYSSMQNVQSDTDIINNYLRVKRDEITISSITKLNELFHFFSARKLNNLSEDITKNEKILCEYIREQNLNYNPVIAKLIKDFEGNIQKQQQIYLTICSQRRSDFHLLNKVRNRYVLPCLLQKEKVSKIDLLYESSLSSDRKKATDIIGTSYQVLENLYAQNLIGFMVSNNKIYKIEKNSSFVEEDLKKYGLTPVDLIKLFNIIVERTPLQYKYDSLRQKYYGLEKIHMWDDKLSLNFGEKISLKISDAKSLLRQYLKHVFPNLDLYKTIFESEDWIVEDNGIPFSFVMNGLLDHPLIFVKWDGTFSNLLAFIHELGHAIHNYINLMSTGNFYTEINLISAESISSFFEYSFLDWLILNNKYLPQVNSYLLSQIRTTIFTQARFSEFEMNLYTKVINHQVLDKNDINELYIYSLRRFNNKLLADYPYVSAGWARLQHLYYGMYTYKYIYGAAIGYKLSKLSETGDLSRRNLLNFMKLPKEMDLKKQLKTVDISINDSGICKNILDRFENTLQDAQEKMR